MGVTSDRDREMLRKLRSVKGQQEWGLHRKLAAVAAGVLLIGMLAGCSSSKKDSNAGGMATASSAAAAPAQADNNSSAVKINGVMDQAGNTEMKKEALAVAQASPSGTPSQQTPAAGITLPIADGSSEAFNRKLIYKANLVMEVPDYGDAQTRLRNLAALSGAFILQFNETTNDRERSGNYTIKVAASGFSSFLDGLEKISPSLQRSVQGQDVTEEYVDLEARLKAKQAVEARLLSFMEKAQKTDELVAFSNELSKVQTEIEQIKGRMRYLDQNVTLSTIELRIYQKLSGSASVKLGDKATFGERLQNAMSGSLKVMGEFGQGLLIVLAAIFPVLILCGIVLAVYMLFRKQRARKLHQIRDQLKRRDPVPEITRAENDSPPDAN